MVPMPRHNVTQGVLVPADSDLPAHVAWGERHLQNLVRWSEAKKGGHFPALEVPHKEISMGKVVFNMTMSLDGFVAGPNDGPDNGLGDGGDALFNWYFSGDTEISISDGTPLLKVSVLSAEIIRQSIVSISGRRVFVE
jgi:hypothetical protein